MLQFLGIGAQKSGTTWLYHCLRAHPEISFPAGKEVHFWDRMTSETEVAGYLDRFDDQETCEGEITPAYAFLPVEKLRVIHKHLPGLRLFFIMRNPIERAWSSALMAMGRAELEWGEVSPQWFRDHFRSAGSMSRGDYARCIENWWSLFPKDAMLLMDYEDIERAPDFLLTRLCAHLGVSRPPPEMTQAARNRVFGGPAHALPCELRAELNHLYREPIQRLEAILGRSFSHWLAQEEPERN